MSKKLVLVLVVALLALSLIPYAVAQDDRPTIGFLPGVVDPFYQVMELGINQAETDSQEVVEYMVGAKDETKVH
jgi:ribose transport system substrate-binding protein